MNIIIKKEEQKDIPEGFLEELDFIAIDLNKNKIVGNIVCSNVSVQTQSNKESKRILCIEPIGVLPEYQNKGIGKMLMEHTINQARTLSYKGIILYGNPKFYHRFGFVNAEKYKLKTSRETHFEEFMALKLKPDTLVFLSL